MEQKLALTSPEAEFAFEWLSKNLALQPPGDLSLTWYVGANLLYTQYASASMAHGVPPISFNHLWVVLQLLSPRIQPGRVMGQAVYTGCRFMRDGLPVFGV